MVNEFALKKLQQHGYVPKFGISKTKKSAIKKYEDSYYVPLAYLGLCEMTKWRNDITAWYDYSGDLGFDTAVGKGNAYISIHIVFDDRPGFSRWSDEDEEMYRRAEYDPNDVEAQTWYQNYKLREENLKDSFQSVEITAVIKYSINIANADKTVYSNKANFSSVEDAIDWLGSQSQEAWGEVNIAVNDNEEQYNTFNELEQALPDSITLNLPSEFDNNTLTLSRSSYITSGYELTTHASEDNIFVTIDISIAPITDDSEEYSRNASASDIRQRTFRPQGYDIRVKGKIIDNNTQLSTGRDIERDQWVRDFGNEGALTIEDAKSVVEQNVREIYDEWKEFIASERNYERVGHGRGRTATYENTESWDYNYGDSYQDIDYENWQSESAIQRMKSEIANIVDKDSPYVSSVRYRNDGTFFVSCQIRRSYMNEGAYDDMDSETFVNNTIESIKTNLAMNGYEIVSQEFKEGYAEFVIRPTVQKTAKMKKAVNEMFKALMKSYKEQ